MFSTNISDLPWSDLRSGLGKLGYGRLGKLLSQSQCEDLRSLYAKPALFRSRVEMERYRFGRGEYQYFAYPLPALVAELRSALYPFLVDTANEWMKALSLAGNFPADLNCFLKDCHAEG